MLTGEAAKIAARTALGAPLFEFTIEGRPVPWARAHAGAKAGEMHNGQRQSRFKRTVSAYCRAGMVEAGYLRPFDQPIAILASARVFVEPPRGWLKSEPVKWAVAERGGFCTERPDLDNWIKLPMDAFQGLVCVDDSQVALLVASGKWWTMDRPRLEIDVWGFVQ